MSEWLTPDAAARYLSVSRATLYRLCEDGRLVYHEVRGMRGRRFRAPDLDRAMDRAEAGVRPPASRTTKPKPKPAAPTRRRRRNMDL